MGEKCHQFSSCSSGETLSPPLRIKLCLLKHFVKGMDKTGRRFEFVRNKFPNVSDAKIKEGIFIGPQIRELMTDNEFDEDLNGT